MHGTALQRRLDVSTDGIPDLAAELAVHRVIEVIQNAVNILIRTLCFFFHFLRPWASRYWFASSYSAESTSGVTEPIWL